MTDEPPVVRVTHSYPAAGDVLRDLGGDAVVVLHALLAESRRVDGLLIATVSLREIAARLALSKDTVHRRLRDLRRAGVIEVTPPSPALLTAPTYRMHLADVGITVTHPRSGSPAQRR
jgi:DNA-binding transcriptional ArsR family regulator